MRKQIVLMNSKLNYYLCMSKCSYVISQNIRNESWNIPIVGVTHSVPWEQFFCRDYDSKENQEAFINNHEDDLFINGIITYVNPDIRIDKYAINNIIGPFREYYGSTTREKLIKSNLQLENPDSYIKSIQSLCHIKSWLDRLEEIFLNNIVTRMIETKLIRVTDVSFADLIKESSPKSYGGNMQHRFRTVVEHAGALSNNLGNFTSHIKTTTSVLGAYSRGGEDYNIFFQLQFLFIEYIISDISQRYHHELSSAYITTLLCPDCTKLLPSLPFPVFQQDPTKNLMNHSVVNPIAILEPILTMTGDSLLPDDLSAFDLHILISISLGIPIGLRIDKEGFENQDICEINGGSWSKQKEYIRCVGCKKWFRIT